MGSGDVKRPPFLERFWSKVDDSAGPDACWPWMSTINPQGYGRFQTRSYRGDNAHRIAWEIGHASPIPEGMSLDHLCRNRVCCNPAHLEPVTHRENVVRGVGPTAINAAKTHCVNGHEFTPENTYVFEPRRMRTCRACNLIHTHNRRAKAFRAPSAWEQT